jgi:hypothetical protein
MRTPTTQIDTLEPNGFAQVVRLVDPTGVRSALDADQEDPSRDQRRRGGVRNALVAFPSLADIAADQRIRESVRSVLLGEPILTRAILFDKSLDCKLGSILAPGHDHRR